MCCAPCRQGKFEPLLATQVFSPNYISDHEESVRKVLAIRKPICVPHFLKHVDPTLKIARVVQSCRYFVIFALGACHDGNDTGYNNAKATGFAVI